MSVNHLEALLRTGARSHKNLEGIRNATRTESLYIRCGYNVLQTELLSYSHLLRSTYTYLSHHRDDGQQE